MPLVIDYKGANVCSFPNCGTLARILIRAELPNALTPLDVPACLNHERNLSGALKLLGHDTEAVIIPAFAGRASHPSRHTNPCAP